MQPPFMAFPRGFGALSLFVSIFVAYRWIRRFTVLEHDPKKTSNDKISEREWRETLSKMLPERMRNAQGLLLAWRKWPAMSERARCYLIHGFAEHGGRYAHLARYLNEKGITVFAMDHQGHGLSEGDRVHVVNFTDYRDDYIQFIKEQEALNTEKKPFFCLGHSMGGAIALQVSLALNNGEWKNWRGTIFSAAVLLPDPGAKPSAIEIAIISFIAKYFPKMPIRKLKAETLTAIQSVKDQYVTDPANYTGGMRARWIVQVMKTMVYAETQLPKTTFPFLAVHGTHDKIVKPIGSQMLHDRSPSKDKSLVMFEKQHHEIHNDTEREKLFELYAKWMTERA